MGYEVMTTFQDFGSPSSGSNVSDWKYVGFLAGNEDSPGSRPGELNTQTSNRFSLQSFFENPPTTIEDSYPCNGYSSAYIEGTEANFSLGYPDLPDDQGILKSTAHNPQTDDSPGEISYSISVGGGLGPISAGASKSYYEGPILDPNPYQGATWTFDYGLGTQDIPTAKDDSVGVMFDFEAQSTEDYVNIELSQEYLFQSINQCGGVPAVLYSGTGVVDLYDSITIV